MKVMSIWWTEIWMQWFEAKQVTLNYLLSKAQYSKQNLMWND